MKKNKNNKTTHQMLMYLGGLVVLGAIIIFLVLRPKPTVAPVTNTTDPSQITITTDDGISLAATIKYPVRNSLSPAVVLLHQYGADRHQWDQYFQSFINAGMVVLSYDMRGFGESRMPAIPKDQETHLASLALDLPAVIKYLQQQPSVDSARISFVGASIGASVDYVGSGNSLGVYRTVLLSPVVRGAAFDGHDVVGFSPSGVFGVSSEKEKADLETFMKNVKDPQQKKVEPGDAHGIALLPNTELMDNIVSWLNQ
jgi:dienelactone hydrolase